MIDIEKEFTCKNCGKEQKTYIGAASMYKINDNGCTYLAEHCCQCGALNYIADGVVVIEEDTEEAKLKALEGVFEEEKDIIGDSEKSKEWLYKNMKFITKDKVTILENEVKTIEGGGFVLY